MNIPVNNPYSQGIIVNYTDGTQLLRRRRLLYTPIGDEEYHTIIQEETLWFISYLHYKDSHWWFAIADANLIVNPFELTLGSILLIPNLSRVQLLLA